jgi:hypothetical protein
MKEKELTPADRVAQADLTKAIMMDIDAKRKTKTANEYEQRAKVELELVEARFSMGLYGRYGRRWQNPFYVPNWRSFWIKIFWESEYGREVGLDS